jgi:hypothetical protein
MEGKVACRLRKKLPNVITHTGRRGKWFTVQVPMYKVRRCISSSSPQLARFSQEPVPFGYHFMKTTLCLSFYSLLILFVITGPCADADIALQTFKNKQNGYCSYPDIILYNNVTVTVIEK